MRIIEKKKEKTKEKKTNIPVSPRIDENIETLKNIFKDCDDIIYREFRVGIEQNQRMMVILLDGISNKDFVQDHILEPLMIHARHTPPDPGMVKRKIYELTLEGAVSMSEMKEMDDIDEGVLAVLSGDTILLMDGVEEFLSISTKIWPVRGIAEPPSESVIRGPREGFVETFRFNTALIRRKIRDPKLKIKNMQLGERTKTDIGIAYIEDIVSFTVLEELEKRLETIEIDGILESGYVEQLIEDSWLSFFPQVQNTERPDEVAAALLEGRVAIIIDNTPFVLIVPATLNSMVQSPEDYYERWWVSTITRWVRFSAIAISLLLPASYIAIASYHPGIIPSKLAIFIAASREGVPFPVFVEAMIMELTFELLREAGVRLPSQIGATIGIVGSLIIGQAAVEAGLVNPIMVIIVALTAIASFAIPSYNLTISFRMLRFVAMIAASVLGLYGLTLVVIITLVHLANLQSFGEPFLAPFVAVRWTDLKDSIVKAPIMTMKSRPLYTAGMDRKRMDDLRIDKEGKVKRVDASIKEDPEQDVQAGENLNTSKGLKKPKKVGADPGKGGGSNG